jgi:hypothetical protein
MVSGGALVDTSAVQSVEGFSLKFGFSILQGFTDETSAQFTVDVPKFLKLYYEVLDPQTGRRFYPKTQSAEARKYSFYRVDKLLFDDLYLSAGFQLIVKDKKNQVLDKRQFNTLDTSPRDARVALLSCMFDMSPMQKEMWQLVNASNPDLLLFMGDNIYADFLATAYGPELMWYRYIISRRTIPFYRQHKLIPTVATWDDHDYGKDNANGDYEHKENSQATFDAFYAQTPVNDKFSRGPGISSSFEAFGRKFILLDGRSYRRLNTPRYKKGYLGDEQMHWFREQAENFAGPAILLTGSQFFGGYDRTNDCYENIAPEEFDEFLKILASRSQPCLFGSGDVHFSEVMKLDRSFLGQTTYEITSSCLHSVPDPNPPKNKRRIFGAKQENFVVLDIGADAERQSVQGLGRGRRRHFATSIDISG